MTIAEKVYGAVSEVGPEDELPADLCERIAREWKVTLPRDVRQRIRQELEQARYNFGRQDASDADMRAEKALAAIKGVREALATLGDDFEAAVEMELGGTDVHRWSPLCRELERVRRAIKAAQQKLPEREGVRGPTILDPLTRILLEHYRQAKGKEPGTRPAKRKASRKRQAKGEGPERKPPSPFVRGVLVAHDALPLRLQEQNANRAPEHFIQRPKYAYTDAVIGALERIPKAERRDFDKERRWREVRVAYLEAHPDALQALRDLSAAGGCYPLESGRLDARVARRLTRLGLIRRWPGDLIGLTAHGEEAWAAAYALMLYWICAARAA